MTAASTPWSTASRQVSIFGRPRLLRSVKPGVEDEVENAVSYFERSFLPELPRLYAHWVEVLGGPKPLSVSPAGKP